MKKLLYIFVLLLLFSFSLSAQDSLNTSVLYRYDQAGVSYNDVWGYVDGSKEYAILGGRDSIYVFDVTNPNNVIKVDVDNDGYFNVWRDFKTYDHYMYTVTDGSNGTGLRVYDLDSLVSGKLYLVGAYTSDFITAHNIYIEEASATLYVAGTNNGSVPEGLIVYDLSTNAKARNPELIHELRFDTLLSNTSLNTYVHDLYVRNDTAYCSHGNTGLYIYDFTDPTAPEFISSVSTNGYNHSSWLSDDGDYLFFAEEVPKGLPIGVVGISNISNIAIDHTFKFPLLSPTHEDNTPHNPFVVGDFLYVSYYEDGLQVFDISDPLNVTQFAFYDPTPNTSYNGTTGVWGCYPFLPSGNILISDTKNGLYLIEVNLNPLPIELKQFSANAIQEKVRLDWVTLSEENSAYFEIERSTDGVEFESIGKVDAMGRSTEEANYYIYDGSPFMGNNYYRLKQVDLDGQFEYSEIVSVYFSSSIIEIYPTFISGEQSLNVLITEPISEIHFKLYNIQGQLIQSSTLSGGERDEAQISVSGLQNGTYILHVFNGSHQVTKRVIVSR